MVRENGPNPWSRKRLSEFDAASDGEVSVKEIGHTGAFKSGDPGVGYSQRPKLEEQE